MPFWFQALDNLGSTKWRVNKKVLSIVDRIWSSGGRLADLVDRADVSCHLFVSGFHLMKTMAFLFYMLTFLFMYSRFPYRRSLTLKMKLS